MDTLLGARSDLWEIGIYECPWYPAFETFSRANDRPAFCLAEPGSKGILGDVLADKCLLKFECLQKESGAAGQDAHFSAKSFQVGEAQSDLSRRYTYLVESLCGGADLNVVKGSRHISHFRKFPEIGIAIAAL
jgi:hypothetical protein